MERRLEDIIEDQRLGYHDGNAVKYILRYKHKGKPVEDLKKAVWYLNRLIKNLEAGSPYTDELGLWLLRQAKRALKQEKERND